MLKKLLGYDLKYILKFLLIFYSLAIFFAVLTRVFFSFDNSLVFNIIGQVCSGTAISMMCSSIINNIMRMWVRFRSNFYGDESYLSHTLPIEKSTHYLSKIITAVTTLIITFCVVAATLFVAYYSKENIAFLKNLLSSAAKLYDSSVTGILASALGLLFLEFFNILQCGFTGIILGHRMNNAKVGFSVLFGFIVYAVSQMAVVAILAIAALFNDSVKNLFITENAIDIQLIKSVVIFGMVVYAAISVVLCFVNIKLFKKGVNVD